jgi:CxxC motif-containing protein
MGGGAQRRREVEVKGLEVRNGTCPRAWLYGGNEVAGTSVASANRPMRLFVSRQTSLL